MFFQCSETCARGTKTRAVQCYASANSNTVVADSNCIAADKPAVEEYCVLEPCRTDISKKIVFNIFFNLSGLVSSLFHPHSMKVNRIKKCLKIWRFHLKCFVNMGPGTPTLMLSCIPCFTAICHKLWKWSSPQPMWDRLTNKQAKRTIQWWVTRISTTFRISWVIFPITGLILLILSRNIPRFNIIWRFS